MSLDSKTTYKFYPPNMLRNRWLKFVEELPIHPVYKTCFKIERIAFNELKIQ